MHFASADRDHVITPCESRKTVLCAPTGVVAQAESIWFPHESSAGLVGPGKGLGGPRGSLGHTLRAPRVRLKSRDRASVLMLASPLGPCFTSWAFIPRLNVASGMALTLQAPWKD